MGIIHITKSDFINRIVGHWMSMSTSGRLASVDMGLVDVCDIQNL